MDPQNEGTPVCSETAEQSPQGWGLLTGWRMIAQDVMNDLASYNTGSGNEGESGNESQPKNKRSSSDDVMVVQSNRLKSVIAKSGENFYMDYQMLDEIGTGAFGRAIKAKRRSDQETVVVKELIGRKMTAKEILEAKNEVKVLAHLSHPNVVRYYDFYSDSGKMHIVMEFCEEGDLSSYLKSRNGLLLEENEIMMKFVQICLALHHTHSQGILHRDLKSQNIFLAAQGILKLGDFGISRIMDGEHVMARSMVGTPYYLSPEICEDKPYGPKSDVWSLGCVLYELCMLKHAFDGQSLPALILKILSGTVPEIPSKYSSSLDALVRRLLSKDPEKRPSISEILNFDHVRTHLQHYGAHIHFSVVRRRDSFQRALEAFNLQSPGEGVEVKFGCRRSTGHSFIDGIQRKSEGVYGSEQHGLDQWADIENGGAIDDDAFEISPYRFFTRDEELDGGKLRLRNAQTETCVISETPLVAEFRANMAKISDFKCKIFRNSKKMRPHTLPTSQQSRSKKEKMIAHVEEYVSENDTGEEVHQMQLEDDSEEEMGNESSHARENVESVVAQIHDILKTPSTQIEVVSPCERGMLPSLTLSQQW